MIDPTPSVRLNARLDGTPSRGLWLVKWLLLIPHLLVLSLLWIAFMVLSVVVLVAVLITGRYPRSIFEFNLGVLRWTWRVWFYGYGALGTDRYPPFSLQECADYPATLNIPYPERLSRGLVLVKWLLALPHYLVIAFFAGGGGVLLWQTGEEWSGPTGGLITLLTLFAGLAMLFTGRYPKGVFDFVVGMNRWVLRVGAYTALMTDTYPPFRMDTAGLDGDDDRDAAGPVSVDVAPPAHAWTAGRATGVVIGALLVLTGFGAAAGGGALLWLNDTQRDASGFLTTPRERYTETGYAMRFDDAEVIGREVRTAADPNWLGEIRVRVAGVGDDSLFVGIARTAAVADYLDVVPHGMLADDQAGVSGLMMNSGAEHRPTSGPAAQDFWAVQASGTGPLTLRWDPPAGNWSLVVMNLDADRTVRADIDFAATAPALRPVAFGVLGGGIVVLAGGAVLMALTLRPRTRDSRRA
jgi:hypothetical protein